MSTNNTQPGFGRRLWRWLIGFLSIVTFLGLFAAIAAGAYFGYIEYQRLSARMGSSDSSVALLRSDMNTLMEEAPSQREVDRLNQTIADLETELEQLQSELSSDMAKQQDVLALLTENVTAVDSQAVTLESHINTLNEALLAVQDDIIANGSQIDALGGEVDSVNTAVSDLGTEMVAMEEEAMSMIEEAGSPASLQETLALFRVWELITRARLRLIESNIGLATADIETAVQTIDGLLTLDSASLDAEKLEMVQARLSLALVNLPDNPSPAAADLESAWNELDQIFTNDILGDLPIGLAEDGAGNGEDGETAVVEEEPTPTPTSTP